MLIWQTLFALSTGNPLLPMVTTKPHILSGVSPQRGSWVQFGIWLSHATHESNLEKENLTQNLLPMFWKKRSKQTRRRKKVRVLTYAQSWICTSFLTPSLVLVVLITADTYSRLKSADSSRHIVPCWYLHCWRRQKIPATQSNTESLRVQSAEVADSFCCFVP